MFWSRFCACRSEIILRENSIFANYRETPRDFWNPGALLKSRLLDCIKELRHEDDVG